MKAESWASWATDRWMHRMYWVLGAVGLAMLAKLTAVLWTPESARTPAAVWVQRIDRCLEAAIALEHRRRALDRVLDRAQPDFKACRQSVTLPTVVQTDASELPSSGSPLARAWYRLTFAVPPAWPKGEPLMVFAPRTTGLAWKLMVDGRAIADNLDDWRMTWIRPVAATVPAALLDPGQALQIDLLVAYDVRSGHALTRVLVGPESAVEGHLKWREAIQFTMPQACSVVLLVLGGFFISVWAARRRDGAPLLLGLASVPWSVCNLQYVLPRADDPTLERWYNGIVIVSVVWFMWLVYLFALRTYPRRLRWAEWSMSVYVLVMSIVALPNPGLLDDEGLVFLIANDGVAAAVTVLICVLAVRSQSTELRVIALALLVALGAGTHDIALLAGWTPPHHIYVLPYAGVLVFCSFLFAVQRRYVHAIQAHEALSESLSQRLAEREAQLVENHRRLRELEREQTVTAERQRLMRDMHDGLGSVLTSSLVAVERGEVQPERMVEILRECVDELRIVIDSLAPGEQDLVAVLATLRFRMERRLNAADLQLEWDIEDLPAVPWLGPSEVMHVLRILQEVLANVMKHARAKCVRISMKVDGGDVEIRCTDDGCGFDSGTTWPGRGLRSISQRCEILGARLQLASSSTKGSEFCMRLPVNK